MTIQFPGLRKCMVGGNEKSAAASAGGYRNGMRRIPLASDAIGRIEHMKLGEYRRNGPLFISGCYERGAMMSVVYSYSGMGDGLTGSVVQGQGVGPVNEILSGAMIGILDAHVRRILGGAAGKNAVLKMEIARFPSAIGERKGLGGRVRVVALA